MITADAWDRMNKARASHNYSPLKRKEYKFKRMNSHENVLVFRNKEFVINEFSSLEDFAFALAITLRFVHILTFALPFAFGEFEKVNKNRILVDKETGEEYLLKEGMVVTKA